MTDSEKKLRALFELRDLVDDFIEEALAKRWGLKEVMSAILPRVCAKLGARGGFVQTYGDDLSIQLFSWPSDLVIPRQADVLARAGEAKREDLCLTEAEDVIIAQPLDVAGTWFGVAGLIVPKGSSPDVTGTAESLNTVCEVLDNFLFAIRAAREKHNVMMELGDALRHRVLGEGLKQAVAVLARAIPIERIVLVYVAEEGASAALHVQFYEGGNLLVDTMSGGKDDPRIRTLGRDYLAGRGNALLEHLGVRNAQEEVLINGITNSVVVGKVVVTSKTGAFNTYDRELLSGFAGFIRQRVVDFNKEWRGLAYSFRPDDVAHLLQSDSYETKYLAPREETVAILYVDIAGFTRLSEQVLRTPSAVAALVESWSKDAVDLVWEHGGVFDKMVGDCIIALFGPPFYETAPGERLAAAMRCALAIRAMTTALPTRPGFEKLRQTGVAVSTGVNLAPLFVGTFGPNSNFTGFSSGMNNTARLQGCAKKDEILVMAEAIRALPPGSEFAFGDEQSAQVKNVADPLRYRELK